ncbi:MAG: hypothetical protein Q4A04_04150 [Eubacteriales bacterium]|nr:hypothetical protein [Eubacteriales bacterium]
MKDLEKKVSLDELDLVAGGVPDMEDIASDMETDSCDGSDGPAHVTPERKYKPALPHRSPVPRKRQR